MGRIIGTILGAILAIWLAFMAAGGIFATLKTFLIIGLIAMAVFIVVWFVARHPRRGERGAAAAASATEDTVLGTSTEPDRTDRSTTSGGDLRYAQARANYTASEAGDCRRPGVCVRRWPTVFGGA